jgi:hypothetical protein
MAEKAGLRPSLAHAFSSRLSSLRKRQSVPSAISWLGLDLIMPTSRRRSAENHSESSGIELAPAVSPLPLIESCHTRLGGLVKRLQEIEPEFREVEEENRKRRAAVARPGMRRRAAAPPAATAARRQRLSDNGLVKKGFLNYDRRIGLKKS